MQEDADVASALVKRAITLALERSPDGNGVVLTMKRNVDGGLAALASAESKAVAVAAARATIAAAEAHDDAFSVLASAESKAASIAAAKAGVYGMTRALACEGEEFGIAVNCVLPHGNPLRDDNPGLAPEQNAEWYRANWELPGFEEYVDEEIAASLADGRRDAAMVSPIVAYLASPACRVTGEAFAAGFGAAALTAASWQCRKGAGRP